MNNQVLLGFDYGNRNIGVAVGQTVTATANPVTIVKVRRGQPEWEKILGIIDTWHPRKLIVGHPLTLAGERQIMTNKAERFARQLENRYQLPVEMIQEQLSTRVAKNYLKSTRMLDSMAAKFILESWLYEQSIRSKQLSQHVG